MLSNSKVPKCVVLMASYNGIPFISEQIDSILSQAEVDVRLFVRDDGSSDGTRDLLQRYADEGSLTLLTGENLGPALGFLTLLRNAPEADYYAFSDQDDIWDSDKLITAIKQLKKQENLALYHCNSRLVDSAGNEMGRLTYGQQRCISYRDNDPLNQLCIGSPMGCTQVFDRRIWAVYKRAFSIDLSSCLGSDDMSKSIPKPHNSGYVLALAFCDYLKDKTGTPKAIMASQQAMASHGISYVYLHSVKKTLFRDDQMLFCEFGVTVDGVEAGVFSIAQVCEALCSWQKSGFSLLELHIHHLLYVSLEKVSELLKVTGKTPVRAFLHDYYLCCTSYNLQNRSGFCDSSRLGDAPCEKCPHFSNSLRVESKIQGLFDSIKNLRFVAPSTYTKNRFLSFRPQYEGLVDVIPHQKLLGEYLGNRRPLNAGERIRVAFLGMPRKTKGWETWLRLVSAVDEQEYEFFVFNSSNDMYPGMNKRFVEFDEKHPNAMTDSLRECEIAIVVMWPSWPETYSYTCMESYSANAYTISSACAGNVADFVVEHGSGLVLNNEEELIGLFRDKSRLIREVNRFRSGKPGPLDLVDSDEIVDLLPCSSVGLNTGVHMHTRLIERVLLEVLNARS